MQQLEEGTKVWRPVKAEQLNNGLYKLTYTNNIEEILEFKHGWTNHDVLLQNICKQKIRVGCHSKSVVAT